MALESNRHQGLSAWQPAHTALQTARGACSELVRQQKSLLPVIKCEAGIMCVLRRKERVFASSEGL